MCTQYPRGGNDDRAVWFEHELWSSNVTCSLLLSHRLPSRFTGVLLLTLMQAIFQVAPHLIHKPIEPDMGPVKRVRKTKNPFLDPDSRFIAAMVGPSHTLLQNKYCVYRPSLVLHTNHFAPQSSDLDLGDLTAAWDTLSHLQPQSQPRLRPQYMLIYNCGANAGSSQAHKHMQVWPYPQPAEIGFDLFPSEAKSTVDVTDDIAHVPHQHFVLRLAPNAQIADVAAAYAKLLARVRNCHKTCGSTAYNVAMTLDWLCLIPRRNCGISRGAGSNTAGMLGLLWILNDHEKTIWNEPSLCEYLQYLGVPRDS